MRSVTNMLSVEQRKEYFILLGLGTYNSANVKKVQKKYFLRAKDVDGKYGKYTDILIRNLFRVSVYAPHFDLEEFVCECKGAYCNGYSELFNIQLLVIVEAVRVKYNKPVKITSALRDSKYNASLKGSSPTSYHKYGRALDIYIAGVTTTLAGRKKLMQWLFKQAGVDYTYCDGWEIGTIVGSRKLSASYMGNAVHFQVRKGTDADPEVKRKAKVNFYKNNKNAEVKSVKIGQACNDEKGGTRGGKVGDQTGHEVCICNYVKSSKSGSYCNWQFVARAKDEDCRVKMAKTMIDICNNNKVGYNQAPSGGRKALYEKLKEVKFKAKNLKNKVDTSCTPVVQASIASAGIKITQGSDAAHLEARIKTTGKFNIYKTDAYTHSIQNLEVGDILNSGRHSAMVVSVKYGAKKK